MGAISESSNKESVFWTEEALFMACLNSSVLRLMFLHFASMVQCR